MSQPQLVGKGDENDFKREQDHLGMKERQIIPGETAEVGGRGNIESKMKG